MSLPGPGPGPDEGVGTGGVFRIWSLVSRITVNFVEDHGPRSSVWAVAERRTRARRPGRSASPSSLAVLSPGVFSHADQPLQHSRGDVEIGPVRPALFQLFNGRHDCDPGRAGERTLP